MSTVRDYLGPKTAPRILAIAASLLSGVCLVALLPVLFLFVDLMVWKGRVPDYAQLSSVRQQQFRDAWNAGLADQSAVRDSLTALRPDNTPGPEAVEWERRWRAAVHVWLGRTMGPAAASHYFDLPLVEKGSYPKPAHIYSESRLGILPTIAREHQRWTGQLLGRIASAMTWTWAPGSTGSANESYLFTLFVLAFLLVAGAGLGALAARHFAAAVAVRGSTRLRRALYLHAYRIGPVAVSPIARAEATNVLVDRVEDVRRGVEADLISVWRIPVVIGGSLLVLFVVNPIVAAFVLCGVMAVWIVAGQVVARFRGETRVAERTVESSRARLAESIARLELVKAYLMDRFAQNRVERQLDDAATAELKRCRGLALATPMLWTVAGLTGVVLLYVLGIIGLGGGISPAATTVILAGTALLIWAVHSLTAARVTARLARDGAAEIAEFLGRRGDPGQPIDAEFLQPITKQIEILGLGVREPGNGRMLLEEVTATIDAGTRVAVVARDRETLHAVAHVLTRFVEPTAGEVKADGKNLRWVTTDSLRTQFAMVMEESMTFTDTVSNNIGCGDPGFGLPQIMEAAKVAHAHQFIQKLPYGYETLIGGPGTVLTPGQQYRIALARAILRDPSVLIVEEPTAPLDPDSLALVDDTFARIQNGRTVIVLAHREATMRSADQIIVLDQGRVAASGTHEMLLLSSDLYRRLGYRDVGNGALHRA
jgi:ATP-binding cassette subfamily B protein